MTSAAHAASKAFVHSLAEGPRAELQDTGVTVTSLMPRPTDTEIFGRADMADTRIGRGKKDDPDDVAADGFKAMLEGRDHVVAGSVTNNARAAVSTVSPDQAAAASMAKMAEPGSGTGDLPAVRRSPRPV